MVYIDDCNAIEHVKYVDAQSHITTNKRNVRVIAQKSERIFEEVRSLADSILMRVNSKKNPNAVHARQC